MSSAIWSKGVRSRFSGRPLAIPAPVDSDVTVEVLNVIASGSGDLHYRQLTSEDKPFYRRSRHSKVLRCGPDRQQALQHSLGRKGLLMSVENVNSG